MNSKELDPSAPMINSQVSLAKRLLLWLMLVAMLMIFAEGGATLAITLIKNSNAYFLIWDPDVSQLPKIWANSAGDWDDELGWPSPRASVTPPRDPTGAKQNSDFPASEKACVSAYGDSFIWGEELPPNDGWIEQLSRLIGCRVSNYGVSGYGTDQALLRFRRMTNDAAPIAILGIFPEDIVRNVVQYRTFSGYGPSPQLLKGRFLLDSSGKLTLIPRPRIGLSEFIKLHVDPSLIVPHDYLLPDTRDGPVTARFPYILSLMRVALHPRLLTRLTGRPSWADFFDDQHPSNALQLSIAIAEAFAHEASERGKRPLIVILPGASSFRARAKFGAFEYAPLVQRLVTRRIAVFDTGPAILATLGERSYCELYTLFADCMGHFGIAGGGVVAHVVAAELQRLGWVH